jgi:hypothetical protein
MSMTIMADIAAHSQTKGSEQLVLLRLAYYADHAGHNAYPSMLTIADQTGITERHVQRCIKALESEKHITVERQKEPGKTPRNIYTILHPWQRAPESTHEACMVHNYPEHMSTDTVSMVQDSLTQMCTDTMSVDPDLEKGEKTRARVREDAEDPPPDFQSVQTISSCSSILPP